MFQIKTPLEKVRGILTISRENMLNSSLLFSSIQSHKSGKGKWETALLRRVSSFSKRRDKVRRERVTLLKECVTQPFKQFCRVKDLPSPRDFETRSDLNFIKQRTVHPQCLIKEISRSRVGQGFTNTLMRRGAKLRYQGLLRKALLA